MNKNVFIKSTNDSFSLKMNLFNCISDLCLFIPVFNIHSSIFGVIWSLMSTQTNAQT